MPILEHNIKLVKSAVMIDVPEGGGPPSKNVIIDAQSNAIFDDISELNRAGGNVSVRKTHVLVDSEDTDGFFGVNVIVAEPPQDPLVSVTIFSTRDTFDTRFKATSTIEAYLIKASYWQGFLLENHVVGQRVIQIFSRPTQPPPGIGRTLVLTYLEDTPAEVTQYVRVIRVESAILEFTDDEGKAYSARVSQCDISDVLRTGFLGTAPNKYFRTTVGKTYIRDTSVADAGSYRGVVPLTLAAGLNQSALSLSKAKVKSLYSQLVPSAATEKVDLDLYPAAVRPIVLATTPRLVEVGISPHSMRLKVSQETRGFNFVQILTPVPSPGTVEVSFLILGEWYKVNDDSAGNLAGDGTGTVNYLNGTIAVTLPALPDVGSSVLFQWGEKLGYVNMSGNVGFRMPEFNFELEKEGVDPGSLVIKWYSGGVVKTATAGHDGNLAGDATGFLSHTTGMLTIRPLFMFDPGGEFNLMYTYSTVVKETQPGASPSAGGFVTLTLAQTPVIGSIAVTWITTRTISATSGSSLTAGSSTKSNSDTGGTNSVPAPGAAIVTVESNPVRQGSAPITLPVTNPPVIVVPPPVPVATPVITLPPTTPAPTQGNAAPIRGTPDTQLFTASGEWLCPAGIVSVEITAAGGGGGGSGWPHGGQSPYPGGPTNSDGSGGMQSYIGTMFSCPGGHGTRAGRAIVDYGRTTDFGVGNVVTTIAASGTALTVSGARNTPGAVGVGGTGYGAGGGGAPSLGVSITGGRGGNGGTLGTNYGFGEDGEFKFLGDADDRAGSGGQAGGYHPPKVYTVTPGTRYAVVVGRGGRGGASAWASWAQNGLGQGGEGAPGYVFLRW